MSRRRASTEAGVSLFPFLAVLVCLIGSLILLLILVSRQSRANALARAVQARAQAAQAAAAAKPPRVKRTAAPRPAPAPAPDPEAEAKRKEQEREAAELEEALRRTEAAQAEARKAAEEGRAILAHLEDHIRQLQDEGQKLVSAENSLQKKLGERGFSKQQLEKELASLRAAEKEKEEAIKEAKEQAGKRKAFAIIPYEGPNGTRREPIYLECRGDRIILQPDGVVFPATDFSGPVGPANPLAATVRAINEHRERTGVDRNVRPYPLMLVRPDGVGAYYAARVALEGWDDEFGYELIDPDLTLAFPQVDSERTALAKRAAEEARYRQDQLAKIAPSLFAGGGGGMAKAGSAPKRFRVSPTGQGIVADDTAVEQVDEEPLFPKGRPSARAAAREAAAAARANGGPPGAGGYSAGGGYGAVGPNGQPGTGFGPADGTNGDGTGGYGTGAVPGRGRPGFSNAGVASVRGGAGGPYVAGASGTGGPYGAGSNGAGGPNAAGGPGFNGPGGQSAFGGTAPGQGSGGVFGGPDGLGTASANGMGDGVGGGGGGPNGDVAANGSNPTGSGPGGAAGQGPLYGDLAANGVPGGNTMNGAGAGSQGNGPGGQGNGVQGNGAGSGSGYGGGPGGGAASGGAQASGGQGGSAGGQSGGGQSGGGQSGGGQSGGGQGGAGLQAGGAAAGGGDPNQGGGGAPSFVFSDPRNANPSGGASGGQSGGTPPSGPPPQGGRPPSSYEPRYGEYVESIASRKGEGWAVGGQQGGSIAVRREVRVNLSRELMKLPAGNKQISFDQGSVPAMEKLAKEIQTQIKNWGVAGRGMHWRPSLVFEVEPSAEERYLEIDQLLVGSGMEVRTVRPITSRTAVGRPPYEARNPAAAPPR